MNVLKILLTIKYKDTKKQNLNSGFTLIELLVALILAVLVITPLLGFMVNILDTDRKEQAKTNTEQEIQTAMDFINRDLQQAVYIYDATGIEKIKNSLLGSSATDGQVPVLVFWKREFEANGKEYGSGTNKIVDDDFKYSLVAYYLIKDNNKTWSQAARIGRLIIVDGDNGFSLFNKQVPGKNLTGKTLQEKMEEWSSDPTTYGTKRKIIPLVDFVDHTVLKETPTCPNLSTTTPTNNSGSTTPIRLTELVPATNAVDQLGGIIGFYACVQSVSAEGKSAVQVFLRGNALARLYNNANDIIYQDSKSSYFPQTSTRVQGRSFVFSK